MKQVFPAKLDYLHEMLMSVRPLLNAVGFDSSISSKIELALEEAIVNIINHGYGSTEGNIEIYCRNLDQRGVEIVLKDRGIPYNPLDHLHEIPQRASPEDLSVGGYGIYLIFKIMDQINYRREDDCNVLTLIKYRTL